jgi:U3 small nucleolar RNA-associated protein 21
MDDKTVFIFDWKKKELVNQIATDFTISAMLHPSTYVNKMLFASVNGEMQLWNIRSLKKLYTFKAYPSPITYLSQSPSIDVVAVGLLDGTVILHNIKMDKEIHRFHQTQKVTAISFRTDGQHIMATASMSGDVALWDLQERRLIHVLHAHDSSIHTCSFFNGAPIMVTASADNSIKQWIFDSMDGVPRLLKSRSGHHQPPTSIKHYGEEGHIILSVGQDRSLRSFSVVKDEQNVELSQGKLVSKSKKLQIHIDALKLPQILQFDANISKQRDWDNIITCHANDKTARSWNYNRKCLGKHEFESMDGSAVKSVALSHCGNFGFIGTQLGRIDKFNMQSGIHRTAFTGHSKSITGIVVDNVNTMLVSSSLDHSLRFWDFKSGKQTDIVQLDTPISQIVLGTESGLLAVVCDDMLIRVIVTFTKKVVRVFKGHENRITSLTFSPDERWIVSASLDGTVRTWDLPTGHMIDAFRTLDLPTSVSFSPTSNFIATTHVGHVGIFLWTNRTLYEHVNIKSLGAHEVRQLEMPSTENQDIEMDDVEVADEDEIEVTDIVDDMIKFSSLPISRWQNLLSLEHIKVFSTYIETQQAGRTAQKTRIGSILPANSRRRGPDICEP